MSEIQKPIDVPTRETADFIASNIRAQSSVLEIGCGEGDVAQSLQQRGFDVTGIDPDPRAVENARGLGLNVICGCWPDVEVKPVDAIAFTRSLHHIDDLIGAVQKASDLLPSQGILLLEDFAFNVTDRETMDWFLKLVRSDKLNALIDCKPDEFITRMLSADDPMEEWKHDKHHDLHSAEKMRDAIEECFEILDETSFPYFYRYFVPVFPPTLKAADLVVEVLNEELELGKAGEIVLVGRRIVAVKK